MKIEGTKKKTLNLFKQSDVAHPGVFGGVRDMQDINYNTTELELLAKKYNLRFIVLHGSYATGKARPDSDVDIAAVANGTIPLKVQLSLHGQISNLFKDKVIREIDFKLLNDTDSLFRYQVVRDGVLLYGSHTDYEEYKAVAYRMYEDAKSLRELEQLLVQRYQHHLNQYYA